MKIIFSGYHNPHFKTVTEYAENAILKLGHDLVTFNDADFLIPGRIRSACKALADFDLKRLNSELVRLNKRHKPRICIVGGGYRILPECVARLKAMGITTVLWVMDPPHDFEPVLKAAPQYDLIFCAGTEVPEFLKGYGLNDVHWLPFACDDDCLRPREIDQKDIEQYGSKVSFVGSCYPNRMEILEGIADQELAIWGPGWERVPDRSPLRKRIRRAGSVSPEEWVKIYCSSNINIALHFQDGKVPCYQASPKVFEILACKGFMICDDQKDVKSLFGDGKHLVIFKDINDLREKIKYYIGHEQERRLIAGRGFEEVAVKHTYISRMKEMLEIIQGKV
jgi:spore maturation protein CgeB